MRKRAFRFLLFFLVLMVLHVIAMQIFEKMPFQDAVWLTLTSVTTVGYGDLSASTPAGRLSTIMFIYVGGIFILAKLAGDYFDFRLRRRERMLKGQWRWKMQDHIVIINTPRHNAEQYFERLISQFRAIDEFREVPIQLLTPDYPEGLHPSLQKLGVIHYSDYADNDTSLLAVNVHEAAYVIILASDETDKRSDSFTFDIIHRLGEMNIKGEILAECVEDLNRKRFVEAGADSVIRPIRAYPELIVRAIVAPGCEKVMENLFTHGGNHTRRYDVTITDTPWNEVVCALINQGLGTALAYLDAHSNVVTDPLPSAKINATGIILLIRAQSIPRSEEVVQALDSIRGAA